MSKKFVWFLIVTVSCPAFAGSPYLVKDLTPGSAYSLVVPWGQAWDSMFFSIGPGPGTRTLYKTDGTDAGTVPVPHIDFDDTAGAYTHFVWHGTPYLVRKYAIYRIDADGAREVVFDAQSFAVEDDGIYSVNTGGSLHRYDGMTDHSLGPFQYSGVADYYGQAVVTGNSALSFIHNGSVIPIHKFPPGISQPFVAGGFILIFADGLWRSDGTPGGTEMFTTFNGGTSSFSPKITAGHRLFFNASGYGLMCTDGTAEGTRLAVDVSNARPAIAYGDQVIYTNTESSQMIRMGITDGTLAGIKLLKIFNYASTGGSSPVASFVRPEGLAYFVAAEYSAPYPRLWQTDGTPDGTKVVSETLRLDVNLTDQLQMAGNRLFFAADDGNSGPELWALPVDPVNQLTIGDLRVAQGDAARFAVKLSHPSAASVAVDYGTREMTAIAGTDFTAQAGTIVFQPGETKKEIAINTLPTGKRANAVFRVQLSNPRGAAIDHSIGSAVIEGPPEPLDLAMSSVKLLAPAPYTTVTATVTNNGPGNISDGVLTFGIIPDPSTIHTTASLPAAAPTSSSSGTTSWNLTGVRSNVAWYATVTNPLDSNRSNDTMIGRMSTNASGDILSYIPAEVHPNSYVFLQLIRSGAGVMTAKSSNPAVATIATITPISGQETVARLTALAPGSTTISIDGSDLTIRVDVLPDGESPRLPVRIDCCTGMSDNNAGITQLVSGVIPSRTPGGVEPTGSLTFTEDGTTLATLPVSGQRFLASLDLGAAGAHTVNVAYSGDASFEPATSAFGWRMNTGTAAIGLTPTAAGITVTLNGTPRATPTGTITVSDDRNEINGTQTVALTRPGTAAASLAGHLSPGPHTFTIRYSGDANYSTNVVTDPLTVRTRAAGH